MTIEVRRTSEVESRAARSGGEAEVDDVAVLDDVLLAFEPDFAVIAAGGHRAARDQRVVADDFGADEAARDVAVNLAGGELRRRAARDRPGPALVLADGEERDVAEQVVARADDAIETGLGQAEIGEKRLRRPRRRAARSRARSSRRPRRRPCSRARETRSGRSLPPRAPSVDVAPARPASCALVEIDDDQQRLRREKLKAAQALDDRRPAESERAQRSCPLRAPRGRRRAHRARARAPRYAHFLEIFLEPLETAFRDAEIREDQFVLHRLRVARGIDRAGRDAAPPDPETRAARARARRRSCTRRRRRAPARRRCAGRDKVGELDRRRHALFRVVHRRQAIETSVGHLRNADRTFALAGPRGASFALVISWKRVDFPLEAKPMRAARSIANGLDDARTAALPRRTRIAHCSAGALAVCADGGDEKAKIRRNLLTGWTVLRLTSPKRLTYYAVEISGQKWSSVACSGATRRRESMTRGGSRCRRPSGSCSKASTAGNCS